MDENTVVYTKLKLGGEVQLNDTFIKQYNPPQRLIDHVFVILEIDGNTLLVDENVFADFTPKNTLLRMWVKPYGVDNKKAKKKIDSRTQEIIQKEPIENFMPVVTTVKEIKYKSKKKKTEVTIENNFFKID